MPDKLIGWFTDTVADGDAITVIESFDELQDDSATTRAVAGSKNHRAGTELRAGARADTC